MGGRAGGGARGGVGLNPDGTWRYAYGTTEQMQKTFDTVYKKQVKATGGDKAFAKRLAITAVNNWYGTDFKPSFVAPKNEVLASKNTKGEGVSLMMPW